jgi:hypothetical protein
MFGSQLVATVASMHGRFRLTEREIVTVVKGLWGLEMSLGSVAEMCQKASEALAEVYEEAERQVPQAGKLNLDETGWKLGKKKHWLWVAVSQLVVVFHLNEKRDSAAFRKIVGAEYGGVMKSRILCNGTGVKNSNRIMLRRLTLLVRSLHTNRVGIWRSNHQ